MNLQPSEKNLIELTKENPFERFPDGRPRVSDSLIERMKKVTSEEAWSVLHKHGYIRNFEGGWLQTHDGTPLVGRAVTAQFLPHRPDFHKAIQDAGEAEGRANIGGQNSWVIEQLEENDVMVVDIFGKIKEGTVIGDNLGTDIQARTKAGAIIDGGIRDYNGLIKLTNVNFFMRGMDPTPIENVTLAGINIPIRIGETTVLPGDIVLGTKTGITFIPSHLVQEVVDASENIQIRDEFGKLRIAEGKYLGSDIDIPEWRKDIEEDFINWRTERNKGK